MAAHTFSHPRFEASCGISVARGPPGKADLSGERNMLIAMYSSNCLPFFFRHLQVMSIWYELLLHSQESLARSGPLFASLSLHLRHHGWGHVLPH